MSPTLRGRESMPLQPTYFLMSIPSSRFVTQRATLALALLAGLSGCQAPVGVAPSQTSSTSTADRNGEVARILELKKRGVISDAQAVEILGALVASDSASATSAPVPALAPAPRPATPPPAAVDTVKTAEKAPAAPAVVETKLDARYQPSAVLTGRLRSIGSDTMDLLVASWERVFTQYHPGLRVVHEGRGSSTATPALLEGQSDFGPMSRAMQEPEVTKFRERFGYEPTQVRVAIDALGIFVHPSNPVSQTGLSLEQIDAIFSATRKRGAAARIATWGQLGVGGEWASAPVNVYGRNKASGTYGFFRDSALSKGEFGEWVQEQPGSSQVVEQVAADKFGIGYSGVGYKAADVALAPLVNKAGEEAIAANEETALDGRYPLARPLYLVANRNPAAAPSDLQREFLSFVLGPLGQEVVKREGYYPLPPKTVAEELAKLSRNKSVEQVASK
jgi:phosphate transport system substrate-binding protein